MKRGMRLHILVILVLIKLRSASPSASRSPRPRMSLAAHVGSRRIAHASFWHRPSLPGPRPLHHTPARRRIASHHTARTMPLSPRSSSTYRVRWRTQRASR
ncbi:hypothetical protein B0H13DRAFT_1961910 [Mycena leptocephala]|nr:hypothetical protein B0H13DRAFT_1961910 [Mycena leptocephala]